MKYFVITLFPEVVESYVSSSILGRAQDKKLITVKTYQLRDYTRDKHRRTDGSAYGGGPGMVLWVDPIVRTFEKILNEINKEKKLVKKNILVVNFVPSSEVFNNKLAKEYAKKYDYIIFICGRYEGVDARVNLVLKDILANKKKELKEKSSSAKATKDKTIVLNFKIINISVGDYILTGGEIPSMLMIDSVSRQIKGVLHDNDSLEENRVASSEVYARPEIYEYKLKETSGKTQENTKSKNHKIKKYKVPNVLLSGHHKNIEEWKKQTKGK